MIWFELVGGDSARSCRVEVRYGARSVRHNAARGTSLQPKPCALNSAETSYGEEALNNACCRESGQFPPIINMQDGALERYASSLSPKDALRFQGLRSQELNPEERPLSWSVLRLHDSSTQAGPRRADNSSTIQPQISVIQIIPRTKKQTKKLWETRWGLKCIRGIRDYTLAKSVSSLSQILNRQDPDRAQVQ